MTNVRDRIVLAAADHSREHSTVERGREPADAKSGGSIENQLSRR
jgi:hypothetical protein